MGKYYDERRGEIVSGGVYYEIISNRHDNDIYDDYISARNALYYGKYKDDSSAFISRKEY